MRATKRVMNRKLKEFALTLALEVAPAVLFAGSVGFAASAATGLGPEIIAASGAAAFFAAWVGLRRFSRLDLPLALPPFELDRFPEPVPDESAVADNRARPTGGPSGAQAAISSDELLLEDVLADVRPDSRVVRLFDSSRFPTAGELQARIDDHLHSAVRPIPAADATQELHEALDALRRSLR